MNEVEAEMVEDDEREDWDGEFEEKEEEDEDESVEEEECEWVVVVVVVVVDYQHFWVLWWCSITDDCCEIFGIWRSIERIVMFLLMTPFDWTTNFDVCTQKNVMGFDLVFFDFYVTAENNRD